MIVWKAASPSKTYLKLPFVWSVSASTAIEISGGMAESKVGIIRAGIDSREKEAYFLPYAKRLKEVVSVPLLLVGGIRSLEVAEEILDKGWADFISLSRPLIREPNLPNEWKNGRTEKAACISCGKCSKYPERSLNCEVIHPGDSERSSPKLCPRSGESSF